MAMDDKQHRSVVSSTTRLHLEEENFAQPSSASSFTHRIIKLAEINIALGFWKSRNDLKSINAMPSV